MSFLKVNFESRESILNDIERISNKFSNDINIKINNTFYRIVDFEFYIFSDNFPDPQTHKKKQQLENGKFYLHSSGIDITFGDGLNYGGILIRGVVKMFDGANQEDGFSKEQFDGPQIVATELFFNLNNVIDGLANTISLIDIDGHNQDASFYQGKYILKTKRVGLYPKLEDSEGYYMNIPLRYVIVLNPKFKFKQKIKGIENLLLENIENGSLTKEDANEILGYKKVF